MAFVDGDYAAAIDHRPPCLWKSLAASRWPPLDLQKIQPVTVPAIRVPAATGHLFLLWNCIFGWRLGSPMQFLGDWRNQLRAMHRKAYSLRPVQLA
jgi:hypothetical protein